MTDLKLAIKLEADGTALVGGVRLSRDELVKLGQAANDAAKALAGASDNVASFSDAQREKLRGLLDTLHPAAARARELRESLALLDQAQKAGEISSREHAVAVANLTRQQRAANDSTTDLSRTLGSLRGVLAPIGGLVAGAFTVAAIKDFTLQVAQGGQKLDQFTARIAAIAGSSASAAVQLDRLYQMSQRLGQGFAGSVEVFQRLGANADALGATNADITRLIETVQKLGTVSGTAPDEMRAGIAQLGQALASGVLQGDELRSILENMPSIARAIADGLGVTVGRLREMGSAGELTGEKVFKALLSASEKADKQFAALPDTMQQARVRMENAWDQFLAALDRKVGASSAITRLTNAATAAAEQATKMVQGQSATSPTADLNAKLAEIATAEAQLEEARRKSEFQWDKGFLGPLLNRATVAWNQNNGVEELREQAEALRKLATEENNTTLAQLRRADAANLEEAASVAARKADIDRDNALGELRGKLQLVIDNEGLLGEKGKMVAETDRDLEKWQKAVNEALADGKPNADAFARALQVIRIESDPVAASMKALNEQIAAFKAPEGAMRATVEFLQKVNAERTKKGEAPLGMDSSEAQTYLATQKQLLTQQTQAQIDARQKVIDIEKRLAREQNDARKAEIQKEMEVQQAVARGVDETVAAAQANQGYEVSIEGINSKLSLQAKQMLEAANAQRRLADAAGAGEAAARAAAYANKLAAERLNPNGRPASVIDANRREEEAALERIRNTAVRGAQQEARANNEMAEAILKGADAVQAAERAEYRRKEILDLGADALKDGTDAQKKLNEMMAAYDERLASIGRHGFSDATRLQREQLALMQTEFDTLGQSNSARELAVKHQQALNDVQRIGKDWTQAQRDAWVQLQDEIAKADQQLKHSQSAWTEIGNTLEKAFERVGDALVQAFVEGKRDAVDWGNLTRAIIASVVTDLVKMAAIRPLTNAVLGQNQPTLWDAFGGQAGSQNGLAAGSTFQGISNIASAGNSIYSIYTGGNSLATVANNLATSSIGGSLGLSTVTPIGTTAVGGNAAGVMALPTGGNTVLTGAGQTFVGIGGQIGAGLPYGAIGGILGGLAGTATNSKAVGGLTGAAAGAGSAALGSYLMTGAMMGPWGLAAAAIVGAVMGMLGTQKATVGPGGGGRVKIENGTASLGAYGVDNGYDPANAKKLGEGAATLFNGLLSLGSGKLDKGYAGQELLITQWTKDGKFQSELDGAVTNKFDTLDEALIDGMRRLSARLIEQGKLTFDNPDYVQALKNSSAKTVEEFTKDLAVGQGFRDTFAQLDGSYDPRSNWIRTATQAQKELGDQVKTNLIDWRDRVRNLGFATDDVLNPAILKGVKAMMGVGEAAQPVDQLVTAAEVARIRFEAFRPALQAIGQTAEQQAALLAEYVRAEQEAQAKALRMVTRRGEWAVESAISPTYRAGAAEHLADYGFDLRRQPALTGLATALEAFFTAANAGSVTAERLRAVYGQLNTDLAAGRITTEQYNATLQDLTQTYQDAQQRAAQAQAATDALALRRLRAEGKDDEASALERRQRHQTELAEAMRAGYDGAYIAGLKYVQSLEAQATAQQRAAQAAAKSADLTQRVAALQGRNAEAAAMKAEMAGFDAMKEWLAAGLSAAQLGPVLAYDRSVAVFEALGADYLEALSRQERAINDNAQASRDVVAANQNLAANYRQAAKDRLLNEDISPLSPLERLLAARAQVDATYAQAMAGDAGARGRIVELLNRRDELARAYYGSSDSSDFWDSQRRLDALGIAAESQLSAAEEAVRLADRQIQEIQRSREAAARIGERTIGSVDATKAAMERAADEMSRLAAAVPKLDPQAVMYSWVKSLADSDFGAAIAYAQSSGDKDLYIYTLREADRRGMSQYLYQGNAALAAESSLLGQGRLDAIARQFGGDAFNGEFNYRVQAYGLGAQLEEAIRSAFRSLEMAAVPSADLGRYAGAAKAAGDFAAFSHVLREADRRGDYSLSYRSPSEMDALAASLSSAQQQQFLALAPAAVGYQGGFDRGLNHWLQFSDRQAVYERLLRSAAGQLAFERGGLVPVVGAYEGGGMVGNGVWGRDSVRAAYAGGGDVLLAGGEYVMPAEETRRYRGELEAMRAGRFARPIAAANDRVPAGVVEMTRPVAPSIVIDLAGVERRLDDMIQLQRAVVYELQENRRLHRAQAAEIARLRQELADRNAAAPRTGTYA